MNPGIAIHIERMESLTQKEYQKNIKIPHNCLRKTYFLTASEYEMSLGIQITNLDL